MKNVTGDHLVVVASALLQISPSSYAEAVGALCQEMHRNRRIDRLDTLKALALHARASDQSVIDTLSTYLLHAKRVLEKDGTPPIVAALRALKRVAEQCPDKIEEARTGVLVALATKTAATGGKDYVHNLLALAKEQGSPSEAVLANLAHGFQNHNSSVREACKVTFGKLCRPGDDVALGVLMQLIQGDIYGWSRCAAIEMMPKVIENPRPEVTACLLNLCREADVAIKSAALRALRPSAPDDTVP